MNQIMPMNTLAENKIFKPSDTFKIWEKNTSWLMNVWLYLLSSARSSPALIIAFVRCLIISLIMDTSFSALKDWMPLRSRYTLIKKKYLVSQFQSAKMLWNGSSKMKSTRNYSRKYFFAIQTTSPFEASCSRSDWEGATKKFTTMSMENTVSKKKSVAFKLSIFDSEKVHSTM